jgi:hypothetical protein
MTHLSSAHPRPSVVAPTVKVWALAFPIVTNLWRDLFKQLVRSYASELPSRRGLPRRREEHYRPLAHASGTQPRVQHVKTNLTMSAPGSPPAGFVRAAGLSPRPAAPLIGKAYAGRANERRSNQVLGCMQTSAARPRPRTLSNRLRECGE